MSLNALAQAIHDNAESKGFWVADRNMGEMLMLAVSELSEALEEHRDGKPNEYVPYHAPGCAVSDWRLYGSTDPDHPDPQPECVRDDCKPEGVAVEVADCIIRCLDILHSLGVDIDEVVARKMAYNATRPHKHGKAY
ncbi:MAG: hypothetical protein Q4F65_12240 [Propionibacteriaceae bacterium]|nr:hypothetical protein [Propionibacteriaceae bacterium]